MKEYLDVLKQKIITNEITKTTIICVLFIVVGAIAFFVGWFTMAVYGTISLLIYILGVLMIGVGIGALLVTYYKSNKK